MAGQDFFNVTRVIVPVADGYCRSARRAEVPAMVAVYNYVDFLIQLPPNQRAPHLERMMWSRPRLAAEAIYRLGNHSHAHQVAMARYTARMNQWAFATANLVHANMQNHVAVPLDLAGNAWLAEGAPVRPVPPPPL